MTNIYHVGVTVLAAALGIMAAYWRRRLAHEHLRRAQLNTSNPNYETFPLMPTETSLCRSTAVTTLTFFKGDGVKAQEWVRYDVAASNAHYYYTRRG